MRVVIRDRRHTRAIREGRVVATPLPEGKFVVATIHNSRISDDDDGVTVESFPVEHERGGEWNM